MDEETELYDVNSPEFFQAFMKAWAKTVDDDRKLGLLVEREKEQAA